MGDEIQTVSGECKVQGQLKKTREMRLMSLGESGCPGVSGELQAGQ